MPESVLNILLDQNIPIAAADWLRNQRPKWHVQHVNEVGMQGRPDEEIYNWAQERSAIIVTYDEDLADARYYVFGRHHGVVRLRVWPTTVETTILALSRLLRDVQEQDWPGSLIIVDNSKIRLRHI
jgi:predicted nuclease of predicted toxin-antitoxin system